MLPLHQLSSNKKRAPFASLGQQLSFSLGVTPEELLFRVLFPTEPSQQKRQWVEGLWEEDVAELFICDPNTGRYQELNLSPDGAWWSSVFSTYRKRVPLTGAPSPRIDVNGREVTLRVRLNELGVSLANAKGNVSAILAGNYLSWTKALLEPTPDFHRTEQFVALSLIPTL